MTIHELLMIKELKVTDQLNLHAGKQLTIIIPQDALYITTQQQTLRVAKEHFMLLQEEAFIVSSNQTTQFYYLSFQSYRLAERTENALHYITDTSHLPPFQQMMPFPRFAQHIIDQLLNKSLISSSRQRILFYELADILFTHNKMDTTFMTLDRDISKATQYIQQNFKNPISRKSVAKLVGFNESYFSSRFKKETGWSFIDYVNRIRIDQAKQLLLTTNHNLQTIALQTGFADASYFSKIFIKYVHMSPGAFKQRKQQPKVVALQFVGALLALQIEPVATMKEIWDYSQLLHQSLSSIKIIENFDVIEQIKDVAPTLIIAPTYLYHYPHILKTIEKIAPVIMLPWGYFDKVTEVRKLGELLDHSVEAEQWVDDLTLKAELARSKISQIMTVGETAALYEYHPDNTWLIPFTTVRSAYTIYKLLNLQPPIAIQHSVLDTKEHIHIQEEALINYYAKHMFIIIPINDVSDFKAQILQKTIIQKLINKYHCQLYFLAINDFWYDEGISLQFQLELIVNLLTEQTNLL